jgi:hypothetical protein
LDGRNEALTAWLDLQEHDCQVSGAIGWLRREGAASYQAMPSQRFLRSSGCLYRLKKAAAARGGADIAADADVGQASFYIFYEDIFYTVHTSGVLNFVAFEQATHKRSNHAKAYILAYQQALIEQSEQEQLSHMAKMMSTERLLDWMMQSESSYVMLCYDEF